MRIVIDTEAIAYRIRRWWWMLRGGAMVSRSALPGICYECGKTLTEDERTYYHCTCNQCEALALQWREG